MALTPTTRANSLSIRSNNQQPATTSWHSAVLSPSPQILPPHFFNHPLNMADDAVIPADLADQPELVRADNNHNNIEYVTVVDIHAPERSSDYCYYKMRRTQRFKWLFKAHSARNGYRNINKFVFLLDSVRVTSECTISSLGYDNRYDCLKLMPIEEWLRKVVNRVGTRPISNDLDLPRQSSRIDPHLHNLNNRNSLNVEHLSLAKHKYRIDSLWQNNWGFSFRSDSYYEEETILTNTNPSISQKTTYVNYAQGHLMVEGSIFFRQTKYLGDDIVQETICVCRVANGSEPSTHANPRWCLPVIEMYEEDEEDGGAPFDVGFANSIEEESFADFITRFGTYMIYIQSVAQTTVRSND